MFFKLAPTARTLPATTGFRVIDIGQIGATSHRVAFDTTGQYVSQSGIARYVQKLHGALIEEAPKDVSLFPLAWEVPSYAYKQPQRAFRTAYRELVWGKLIARRELRENDADLLHSTSSLFISRPSETKHVVTLHDLSISRHPERFRKWQVASWHRRLGVITSADRVICISQFTADEAMNLLGVPASKIDVIHHGCDWLDGRLAFEEAAPDIEVPNEFFLFVGNLEPGKNLKLLREAYLHAAIKGRSLPPLLVVGLRWAGVLHEGEQPRGWHYLGRPSDAVLLYLYRRAHGLIFPSKYEGFGMPVLEAMSQGCPVICSPVSSLPEIAGDAALMAPLTAAGYVSAMRRLLRDPSMASELGIRGRARAAQFNWSTAAKQTLDTYRKALKG